MVKRLLLLSLLVLALCGASALVCSAGGPGTAQFVPPPPAPPPICGPAQTEYSVAREFIAPIPAQLRKVRVVAPYLAGIAWPRTPLAFGGNPQTYPDPIAPGRYEWLVPVVEVKNEQYWTYRDPCCKPHKVERCVYVKANYVKPKCFGPIPMAPPPPVPSKVKK